MKIIMMTNTFLPHTGGVARSVAWFSDAFRQRGHQVLVVAPTFENLPEQEQDVIRVPAVQKFNGSDFSVRLPIPHFLTKRIDEFRPQIVHSHHPFLLGHTALRVAALRNLPVVFTHHTMYEWYTHYVPADSPALQRFAMQLATEYANACDHVIAPSQSTAEILCERGVKTPISAIPTGIDKHRFADGNGRVARCRYGIPDDAFVVGHVGRLAPEKNLAFLARAVAGYLRSDDRARFLLVGSGPSLYEINEIFRRGGVADRLHHPEGDLDGQQLADAYHAMDVFVFASQSETPGMVLAEAMTAGVPVVALDAPGVREVVCNGINGRLLLEDDHSRFREAISDLAAADKATKQELAEGARRTAETFSMDRCVTRVLALYEQLIVQGSSRQSSDQAGWAAILRLIEEEWNIWAGLGRAAGEALLGTERDTTLTS